MEDLLIYLAVCWKGTRAPVSVPVTLFRLTYIRRRHGMVVVFIYNNNNNNCLKSNIQCIEIRVQWTVHLGSSHMHVHAVTRVHAVTPKLVICVMYLTSI